MIIDKRNNIVTSFRHRIVHNLWNPVQSGEIRYNTVQSGEVRYNPVPSCEIRWIGTHEAINKMAAIEACGRTGQDYLNRTVVYFHFIGQQTSRKHVWSWLHGLLENWWRNIDTRPYSATGRFPGCACAHGVQCSVMGYRENDGMGHCLGLTATLSARDQQWSVWCRAPDPISVQVIEKTCIIRMNLIRKRLSQRMWEFPYMTSFQASLWDDTMPASCSSAQNGW